MENNNNIVEAHWGKTISEARTYEEYKGAGVFADLLTDRTFKKAFNPDTKNKVCLIALLNAVLEGEISSPIVDVQSRDKEFNDGSNENRTTVFDLYCIDSAQRRFIIEVQLLMQENIVNRAIYYASQTVIAQGERGQKYNYELKPVVTVVFMEFNVFVDDRYIRRAKLREINGASVSEVLSFAFVELPKFNKPLDQLETTLDRGLYALKNMKNMTQMPKQYANTAFELLFSSAYLAKLSKEEQKMIDEAQKAKWDEYAINKAALDRGRNQKAREVAKDLLIEGDSVEKVVRVSKLSEADVLAIKAEIDQK
jgi:predicted transposase/invertase (TIGR01784 family)